MNFHMENVDDQQNLRLLWQAAQDSPLLRALGLAHHWQRLLDEGRFSSITEIATAEEIDLGHASHIARLALLSPDIISAYVAGGIEGLALEHLTRRRMPTGWDAQRERVTPRAWV